MSRYDREEAAATESVLPVSLFRLMAAHLRAVSHPVAYCKTLRFALAQAPAGMRGRLRQLFYFGESIYVWAWARRHRVEHLHAHLANVATDDVWLASVFDRFTDGTGHWGWSFTMHGPTEFFGVERFNLAAKVAAADRVVCISDFCRSQLMLLCPPSSWDKLTVVRCGADLDRYRFRPPRPINERLAVYCVGRLVQRKGQAILLEALASLRSRVDATVTLAGSGPAEDSLRQLAERLGVADSVTFAGPVGQDELPLLLARHDVFCLPSFAEGVPVVLMEAMAVGLPVVSTQIAGVPELVTDGSTGLLVPPGRADALACALLALATDEELVQKLAAAGRLVVEQRFDSVQCASQLAAEFERRHRGSSTPGSAQQDLLHDL
jgi:glycosyltransferase involved in cell wall biosynthesis